MAISTIGAYPFAAELGECVGDKADGNHRSPQLEPRQMPHLPPCLLIVTAEIDPAVEADWNRWYDEVHLPEALTCPGVLRGTRYLAARDASLTDHGEKTADSARVYAAVYELQSPEALDSEAFRAMAVRGWERFTDRIRVRAQVFRSL